MPHATKVATCCYCGTRAALVLRGRDRHELSCSSCGAPLHELKLMPLGKPGKNDHAKRGATKTRPVGVTPKPRPERKRKKPKKRKGRMGRLLGDVFDEAFDVIEDIFD